MGAPAGHRSNTPETTPSHDTNAPTQCAVTSCEPPLPELAELAPLLRQENRFADFVKGARRGFAGLVQREIEADEARTGGK